MWFPDDAPIPEVLETLAQLSESMQSDPDYAWTWHSNIAVAYMDEGGDLVRANRAASRVMRVAFGVDMEKDSRCDWLNGDVFPRQESESPLFRPPSP